MFNENIYIYIQIMQTRLPIRNRILLYISEKDFLLVCTGIMAMKMLILWLKLPRVLVGYLKTEMFFYVVYISIEVL